MDHVTLANRAVARIGGIAIQSFDAPGPSGPIVETVYMAAVEALLGKYPWHFARKKAKLARTGDVPVRRWTYSFALPGDRLGPPRAIYDAATETRPFTGWEPDGERILTDAEDLWAVYPWLPPPNWWPAYFRELVVKATQAELAGALREDWSLRAKLLRETFGDDQYQGEGGEFAVATALDAQSAPSPVIDGGRNPLIAVRFSPGDSRAGFEDW